jgi:hypothetical protein
MAAKNDFAKAIEESQGIPEAPDLPSIGSPDLLSASMGKLNMGEKVKEGDETGGIPGMMNYDLEYHSARLTIGQKMVGFVDGHAEFVDLDESERLQEIMNLALSGKALLLKRDHSFLKDGTVIVWLEWGVYKTPPPKKDREYFTTEELRSPEYENSED